MSTASPDTSVPPQSPQPLQPPQPPQPPELPQPSQAPQPLQAEREVERSSFLDSQASNGACLKDYAKIVYLNIPTAHLEGSHVVYDIEVGIPGCMWRLSKRYSEFFNLHQQLQWFYSFHSDELPKKKLLGNKTSALIEKRRSKLESYLKHVLRTFPIPPPQFLNFINYQYYDVVGVTQALASRLFHVGEKILASNDPAILSVVQMYCITRRLKLPLEKRSNDTSLDVANLYEFVNRLKHLKLVSDTPDCLSSSLLSELKFDLSIFRNLHSLQMEGCSMQQVEGWAHLLDTLEMLVLRKSAKTLSDALLQPGQSRSGDQLDTASYPPSYQWRALTHIYLSNNFLREVDRSIMLAPYLQFLDLSHNSIEEVPETVLTHLHVLSFLDLSHNKLENVESLHTKLGNIHTLDLSYNRIRSLVGLRKLYCVVTLNLKFNSIDDLSYLGHLGKLPCLESLQLDNNPICYQPRYRAEVFGALPLTYDTVMLDGHRATCKELSEAKELISKRPVVFFPSDTPSEGRRPAAARRVVAVSEDPKGGLGEGEGEGERERNVVSGGTESLREATEQLREQQGRDWLSRYNEQLERDAVQRSPVEPTAIGQHPPPSKAQGYVSGGEGASGGRMEIDIRQLPSERSEGDLTPAARVSHVLDLEGNSESEEQAGQVFMVEAATFSGALSDLRALDAPAFQALTTPDTEHESLVVKIDLETGQILFVSLDNTRSSESPKHFERWKSIAVLPTSPTTVCIEESSVSAVSCRLLCLPSTQEASQLCQMLHDLVGGATDPLLSEETSASDPTPPSGPSPPGDRELTKVSLPLFTTAIRGLYSGEGFYSSRVASDLLSGVYYLQDLVPGGPLETERFNLTDDTCQEEDLALAVRAGFLPPLSSRVEFHSLVLVTNRALHILELDPVHAPLGETSHLLTLRLSELSRLTIGLFEQSLRFESSALGPIATFSLFTRAHSVAQSLLDTLKEVLLAAGLLSEDETTSHGSASSHLVQIEHQGVSHLNELKKRLFLHSIKDTYNSMNPEDMEAICEEGVKSTEVISYLVINQVECVEGQEMLVPVSLILTKQMLYLCAEDYNEVKGGVAPVFQVLQSNPVSTLDNMELFRSERTDRRAESELRLYFEGIEELGGTSMWRLYITDAGARERLVSDLKKQWEQEFSQALKTSTSDSAPSLSLHYHSLKQRPRQVPHIVMPQELVSFAWQGARSPSAFQGVMKRMCPSIKQRQEEIAYVMLTWCSPYTRPHSLVPTCVVLTDLSIYLCTSRQFFSLASDKPPGDESAVCLYDSLNLVQIQQVVLGLFDYHFRLDTNYSTNTYAFLTFDNLQTSLFMSYLGDRFKKVLNPSLGQEEIPNKEVSELEAKFSLTEVLLSSPSDTDIQTLAEALEFEARKIVPPSQLEGPSSIISYVLVLYDIGEANMQPHAVLITGQALFLCRIDLVRWPIAQFVVSPPTTLQYEVVDVIAFEWIEHIEISDFKSSTFKVVFTPQRNTEPGQDTHSNSGSEECLDLSQPLIACGRWSLMTKDHKQRDFFLKALDGVYQGRGRNRPVIIQLATTNAH